MEDDEENFGTWLRDKRQSLGIHPNELCLVTSVSIGYIRQVEESHVTAGDLTKLRLREFLYRKLLEREQELRSHDIHRHHGAVMYIIGAVLGMAAGLLAGLMLKM